MTIMTWPHLGWVHKVEDNRLYKLKVLLCYRPSRPTSLFHKQASKTLAPDLAFRAATKLVLSTFAYNFHPINLRSLITLESDLDIQYITAMGAGVPTLFDANQNGYIYEWATFVVTQKVPSAYVHPFSQQLIAWTYLYGCCATDCWFLLQGVLDLLWRTRL